MFSVLSHGEEASESEKDYAAFFRAHHEMVARAVYGIVQDVETAKDIAQDAFALCFSKWERVSHYDLPEAWVRRVAIRLATKRARRDARRELLQRKTVEMPAQPSAGDPDVARALRSLSPTQRAAVVLTFYAGYTSPEVAEALDCSEATVRVHLHRARARLRGVLGGRGG